jgi:hypothetical protein
MPILKQRSSDIVVVCADVGSVPNGRFGWYADTTDNGTLPSTLAAFVGKTINSGRRVALGFECPLFVPLRMDEQRLTLARPGEGNRSWSAGAGCGALATGLVQVTWVLQAIRSQIRTNLVCYLSWPDFATAESGLFVWEAFVSGNSKRDGHIADATCAVDAFKAAMPNIAIANAVIPDSPVHSLIGGALMRTGWTNDLTALSTASIVIRG